MCHILAILEGLTKYMQMYIYCPINTLILLMDLFTSFGVSEEIKRKWKRKESKKNEKEKKVKKRKESKKKEKKVKKMKKKRN